LFAGFKGNRSLVTRLAALEEKLNDQDWGCETTFAVGGISGYSKTCSGKSTSDRFSDVWGRIALIEQYLNITYVPKGTVEKAEHYKQEEKHGDGLTWISTGIFKLTKI